MDMFIFQRTKSTHTVHMWADIWETQNPFVQAQSCGHTIKLSQTSLIKIACRYQLERQNHKP